MRAIALAVCALVWLPSAPAAAQAAPASQGAPVRDYSIPAGPLAPALRSLASSANVLLTFTADQTDGKQTAGLNGTYTVQAGLNVLLAGTDLQAVLLDNGAHVLRPVSIAASAPAAGGGEAVLNAVKVSALAAETAEGPVHGYAATRSATGTKTDTPLLETPQSITVIGAEQIETLKAQSLSEAIAYSVGALRAPYTERTGDEVVLRGFGIPMSYRDGLRYQVNRFDGQQEPYGLERIEVIKGAASILYGAAEPGGVLNTVSKRPTTDRLRELNVELGSFDRKQVSGDFAGALTDDGVWSYRLTGLLRDSGTFVDHVHDNRTYVAPALKWQPDAATSLTLLAEYQRDDTAYGGDGLPTVGTVLPNPNGPIPRNRFLGEPGYDRFDTRRLSVGYVLEHRFTDRVKLRQTVRQYRMDQDWSAISIALDLDTDQRTTLDRSGQDRQENNTLFAADTSLQVDWTGAGMDHKTLVGIDYTRQSVESGRYERTAGPLDLYAPVYGGPVGDAVPSSGWRSSDKKLGLYAQDQMKLGDRWVLLAGGRQDWVQQTECGYFNASDCYIDHERSNAFTGRVGAVYLAPNGVAPYASFSQSFQPVTGLDAAGNRLKPTRGEQVEAGVRYQPAGQELMLSAAVYQLTQRNLVTADLNNDPMQQGKVRSRGVELEARGRVGRHGQVLGAYTYTDARTLEAGPTDPDAAGKRSPGVPYNQFSLWGDYGFDGLGVPGLRMGLGGRHVSETSSQWHDIQAPAYTVFDAMASYTTGPWRFALNATNVTDKVYVTSCPYRCFYGEPRKVIGTATYRW